MATKKRFNFNRIKIFIIIGVLVYAGVTFYNQQSLIAAQSTKQKELLTVEEELKNKIAFNKNELEYIGSLDYIEKQARERLGWLKEGEIKYIDPPEGTEVYDNQPSESQSIAPSVADSSPAPIETQQENEDKPIE